MSYKLIGRKKYNWRSISHYMLLDPNGNIKLVPPNEAIVMYEKGEIDGVKLINKVLRITYTNDRLVPSFNQDGIGRQANSVVILRALHSNREIVGYTVLLPSGTQKNLRTREIIDTLVNKLKLGFLNATVVNGRITGSFPHIDIDKKEQPKVPVQKPVKKATIVEKPKYTVIKETPKYRSNNTPIFEEFPSISRYSNLRYFCVESYPSVIFEVVTSEFVNSLDYKEIQGVDRFSLKLIVHIILDENTPADLIINPPLLNKQIILGSAIYRGHCLINTLSVKASVVLDSAFCDLKNVLFRNIFIYCGENGYIGNKSFYKANIENIEINSHNSLIIGDSAFECSTLKSFNGGFDSLIEDYSELSLGVSVFKNCIFLSKFQWKGVVKYLPDNLFHNCVFLQKLLIACFDDLKLGRNVFYYDDNSNKTIPDNIDKEKFLRYLNQCKKIRKERVIEVLHLNNIVDNQGIKFITERVDVNNESEV